MAAETYAALIRYTNIKNPITYINFIPQRLNYKGDKHANKIKTKNTTRIH